MVYQSCSPKFQRSASTDRHGLPSRYILNVGTIERRKNVLLAVKALPLLPAGVRSLVDILRSGICDGSVEPFRGKIYDRQGVLRCDGEQSLSLEQILAMDWLCDNVDGEIPPFEQILPQSRELVRRLGVYRDEIAPQKLEKQL